MNRLPAVLQNEIWEYVRGDRAYWKHEFRACLIELAPYPMVYLKDERKNLIEQRGNFTNFIGGSDIEITRLGPNKWRIHTTVQIFPTGKWLKKDVKDFDIFEDILKEYRDRIKKIAKMWSDDPQFSRELRERTEWWTNSN